MPVRTFAAIALVVATALAAAQQPSQLELKIDSANRTITVSAEGRVEVDPDVAILHIGFETKPSDAKSAYADGARISNAIVDAIKQAGIPEASIHSESQRLEPVDVKNHKFKLTQNWTVKTPSARAGEILEIAIDTGATNSGEIEWTVENIHALEDQALEQATTRARDDAAIMAKASGVHLGNLLYLTNQLAEPTVARFPGSTPRWRLSRLERWLRRSLSNRTQSYAKPLSTQSSPSNSSDFCLRGENPRASDQPRPPHQPHGQSPPSPGDRESQRHPCGLFEKR